MSRRMANFLLLIAAVLWGVGNVGQQTVLEHIGPVTATGFKCLIAAGVILPFCWRRNDAAAPLGRDGWRLGLVVAVFFVVASVAMQAAYGLTTVTNAGFLINTSTVLTPVVGLILLRQQPGGLIWQAAIVTFAGIALLSGGRLMSMGPGEAMSLLSALCFAVWMVFLGEFSVRYGRAGPLTVAQFLAAAVVCIPWGLAAENPALADLIAAVPELLLIGGLSTAGGFLLQAVAQRYTSASEAAVLVSAEAVFGAGFAVLLLGETLDGGRALGAVLIGCGIVLVQLPGGWRVRRLGYVARRLP